MTNNIFTFEDFIGEEKITVPFPERYKGKAPVEFFLRLYTVGEADAVQQAYMKKDAEERVKTETINWFVRNIICALMTQAPKNLGDFPKDDRPLLERAREYFICPDNPAKQEFLDSMLGNAYAQLQNKIEDGLFYSLPQNSAGDSDVQSESAEGESGI